MSGTSDFLDKAQQAYIVDAIKKAELQTSGEIRVHIESKCKGDAMERAYQVFEQLEMHNTEQRNGILFYLATDTRDFAVVGDKGIHEKVGNEFWDAVKDKAIAQFKNARFAEGLGEAILECGGQLKKYFPFNSGDVNELSDDVTFS